MRSGGLAPPRGNPHQCLRLARLLGSATSAHEDCFFVARVLPAGVEPARLTAAGFKPAVSAVPPRERGVVNRVSRKARNSGSRWVRPDLHRQTTRSERARYADSLHGPVTCPREELHLHALRHPVLNRKRLLGSATGTCPSTRASRETLVHDASGRTCTCIPRLRAGSSGC